MFKKYNKKKYESKILVFIFFIIVEAVCEGVILAFIAELVNRDFSKLWIRFLLYTLVIFLISFPIEMKKYRRKQRYSNL